MLIKTDVEMKDPAIEIHFTGDVFEAKAAIAGGPGGFGKATVEKSTGKVEFESGAVLTPDAAISATLYTQSSLRVYHVSKQLTTMQDVIDAGKALGIEGKAVRRREVEE